MQFRWKQCWRLRCRKRPQRWKEAAVEPQAARLSVRAAARTVEISFFMVVISFLLRLFFRFVFVLSYVVVFLKQRNTFAHRAAYSGDCISLVTHPFYPDKRGDKIFI